MQHLAYVNGAFHPAREARVPALDAGMQFGAGVFETLLAVSGRVHLARRHLARLRASCTALGIPLAPTDDALEGIMRELLERSGLTDMEARVKIIATPGDLAQHYTHRDPTLIVTAEPYVRPPLHIAWKLMVPDEVLSTPIAGHKSTSYFSHRLLLHRARAEGYDDAILLDRGGNVAETTIASILLFEDGRMLLPESPDRLEGITAGVLAEAAESLGMEVRRRAVAPEELTAGAAVCVCNSLLGPFPVQRIGDREIPAPAPSAVTALRDAWMGQS